MSTDSQLANGSFPSVIIRQPFDVSSNIETPPLPLPRRVLNFIFSPTSSEIDAQLLRSPSQIATPINTRSTRELVQIPRVRRNRFWKIRKPKRKIEKKLIDAESNSADDRQQFSAIIQELIDRKNVEEQQQPPLYIPTTTSAEARIVELNRIELITNANELLQNSDSDVIDLQHILDGLTAHLHAMNQEMFMIDECLKMATDQRFDTKMRQIEEILNN